MLVRVTKALPSQWNMGIKVMHRHFSGFYSSKIFQNVHII
jgi:hypothetical protein